MASSIVKFENVRLSFPALFQAEDYQGNKQFSYRASFIMPRNTKVHVKQADKTWKPTTMHAVLKELATSEWKGKGELMFNQIVAGGNQKCCWFDGDAKTYDGYGGNWILTASRKVSDGRPEISDRDKTPLTEMDGKPYAGCYVNASVEVWTQANQYGNALRATLRAVQFFRDGDAFKSGAALDDDELGAVSDPDAADTDDSPY